MKYFTLLGSGLVLAGVLSAAAVGDADFDFQWIPPSTSPPGALAPSSSSAGGATLEDPQGDIFGLGICPPPPDIKSLHCRVARRGTRLNCTVNFFAPENDDSKANGPFAFSSPWPRPCPYVNICRQDEGEEMKTILKQVLITPGNYRRMAARIVPQDQRDAIRPGIRISHYAFTDSQGQQGYVIVCHTTGRAGIRFAEERTLWGRWNEETGTIITDGGRLYDRAGEEVADSVEAPPEHAAPTPTN